MKLKKFSGNPILLPNPKNAWESAVVCNPGVIADQGKVYMLYRAAGRDKEHKIHFGLAVSNDGFKFKRVSNKSALSPSIDGYDAGCIEDARIVKMGKHFLITYAFRPFPPGQYWKKPPKFPPEMPYLNEPLLPKFIRENLTMSGLLISKDLKSFIRAGALTDPNEDDRDVILFPEKVGGRFVMFRRPQGWVGPKYGCKKPSMWISFADDLLVWKENHLLAQSKFKWESKKIGGSTPPIKTSRGWLVLYHGVDEKNVYRTGMMMLDLKNPRKVIARCPNFIMEPEFDFETKGVMPVSVVFPTGNIVIKGQIYVYYGGGDKTIGVATAPLKDLVDYCMSFRAS